ncbi:MAG: hypothetical protein ABSC76_01430 [Terracidiphilus sp.]
METSCKERESRGRSGFWHELNVAFNVMSMFLYGIKIAVATGIVLYAWRLSDPVKINQLLIIVLVSLLIFELLILDLVRFGLGIFQKDSTFTLVKEVFLFWTVGLCMWLLSHLHAAKWAPVAIGLMFAAFFGGKMNPYKRAYPFVSAGCILSGFLAQRASWLSQRHDLDGRVILVLFGISAAMAIQGAWIVVAYFKENLPTKPSEKTGPHQELVEQL